MSNAQVEDKVRLGCRSCLERLGGSVDLHCGAGFGGAQGKDTGHSGAGQGVCCRLEAEMRDASAEQRALWL